MFCLDSKKIYISEPYHIMIRKNLQVRLCITQSMLRQHICQLINDKTTISFFVFAVQDKVSLCGTYCPGAHYLDQAGHKLRNPPTSAYQGLGFVK